MSISVLTLESIVSTPAQRACSLEKRYAEPSIEINRVEEEHQLGDCIILRDQCETFVPAGDWRGRMIAQILPSQKILSITFVPYNSEGSHTLFVQKISQLSQVTGLFAPHLPDKLQKQIQATALPSTFAVKDQKVPSHSLIGLEKYWDDLIPILTYFIEDPITQFIGLTFLSNDSYFSLGWKKV